MLKKKLFTSVIDEIQFVKMKEHIILKDFVEVKDMADKILSENTEQILNHFDTPFHVESSLYQIANLLNFKHVDF
jgi:hypothetical protein